MTERDLLRTALIIPPKGRAVCSWASVPGMFCAPFVFWQSRFAGCIFCARTVMGQSVVPLGVSSPDRLCVVDSENRTVSELV